MSNRFAAEKSADGRCDRFYLADGGVVDDQLGPSPVDSGLTVLVGQAVIEDAIGLVRLVESVVDESVGDFAQTSPAGPGRLARIVGHVQSGRLVVPAFAPRSVDRFIRRAGRLTETVGPAPSRRPDEQSEFAAGLSVPVLLLVAVLIRRKRQLLASVANHHHIQLAGRFRMLQPRMVHDGTRQVVDDESRN